MDPDLNKYDLETVTAEHPQMSREEWQQTYRTCGTGTTPTSMSNGMMSRNSAYGIKPVNIWRTVLQIYGASHFEGVHPQQCGYFRRKDRTQRRPELPRVPALLFYPAMPETLVKYWRFAKYGIRLHAMRRRVERDPAAKTYTDLAITKVVEGETELLEMFELTNSSRAAVEKAKRQADDRRRRTPAASVAAE